MQDTNITRRRLLCAAAGVGLVASPALAALADPKDRGFNIATCDWSIGKAGQVASLEKAKSLGIEGVQASFGAPGEGDDLRLEAVRKRYAEAERATGVKVQSLAMTVLSGKPLATDPDSERYVEECIDTMAKMGQRIVLLAFFGGADLKDKPDDQAKLVERLKRLAPKAEKAGVTLGIESWLNAQEHLRIVEAVDSPAVQVYYDVANMTTKGYDIHEEIRLLGKKGLICEIHCKENGYLLGQGQVDFPKLRATIDEVGYRGWLIIEGAVPDRKSMEESYVLNAKYLRELFPEKGNPSEPNVRKRA